MEQIPPFWWMWFQPAPTSASDSSTAADSEDKDTDKSGGSLEEEERDPERSNDPVIWVSTHSADNAVGNVIVPLYSREYFLRKCSSQLTVYEGCVTQMLLEQVQLRTFAASTWSSLGAARAA